MFSQQSFAETQQTFAAAFFAAVFCRPGRVSSRAAPWLVPETHRCFPGKWGVVVKRESALSYSCARKAAAGAGKPAEGDRYSDVGGRIRKVFE